jgi:pimeloyl-ACP methyl ester carboxylesterase
MIFFSSRCFCYGQQLQKVSPAGTRFFIYTPTAKSTSPGPYPLLLSLHGQGNMGDNLNELLDAPEVMPAKLIHEKRWPENYPFIVVTPQLNPGTTLANSSTPAWPPVLVNELINYVLATNNIDSDRIYVTGFSMGGTGTWDYAAAFPERVTAMIPIAGRTDTAQACLVKNIPTWVFHGSNDPVVVPTYSTSMVRAINACQPRGKYVPHLTLLYAQQHEGWSSVYDNSSAYNIYDWLLQFSKSNHSNKPPYVNAGLDMKIASREDALHLYGEYFDIEGSVSKVLWRQVAGPSLALEGFNTRFLKILHPATGSFEFELQVTDNQGAQNSDRIKIEIQSDDPSQEPQVTELILTANGKVIGSLTEDYRINPDSVRTDKINIRAVASANALSVRFKINGNHNLRTADNPGSFSLSTQEWDADEDDYLICATPYADKEANDAPGVSQCFKIIISRQAPPPVVTGLQENDNKIKLYPNPTSDWIHLEFTSSPFVKYLYIIDTLGNEVYRSNVNEISQNVTIPVNGFAPGVYFVIVGGKGTHTVLKFVIK